MDAVYEWADVFGPVVERPAGDVVVIHTSSDTAIEALKSVPIYHTISPEFVYLLRTDLETVLASFVPDPDGSYYCFAFGLQ